MREYFEDFNDMYRECRNTVFNFIYSLTMCRDTAEDLTHDVFLKICENNASCLTDDGFCTNKLMTIARNTAYDHFRRIKRYRKKINEIACIEEAKTNDILSQTLDDFYIYGEVIASVHDVINSFPERKREIFNDCMNNKIKKEIGRQYGISHYKIIRIEKEISDRIKQRIRDFDCNI